MVSGELSTIDDGGAVEKCSDKEEEENADQVFENSSHLLTHARARLLVCEIVSERGVYWTFIQLRGRTRVVGVIVIEFDGNLCCYGTKKKSRLALPSGRWANFRYVSRV